MESGGIAGLWTWQRVAQARKQPPSSDRSGPRILRTNIYPTMNHKPATYRAAKLQTGKATNQQMVCRAPGCAALRVGLHPHCKAHVTPGRRHGHPHAKALDPRLWQSERLQVRELFAGHPDHPGLVAVLQYATRWLAEAKASAGHPKVPTGTEEVARLASWGVSALEVVTEACSFKVWEARNPRSCPDGRAWTFALARAVLLLAPRPRKAYRPGKQAVKRDGPSATYATKPLTSSVEAIGNQLREVWAPFYVTVRAALDQREQQKVSVLEAMRAPFDPPRATLVDELAQQR